MTARPSKPTPQTPGQLDLFGGTTDPAPSSSTPTPAETNDIDLIQHIAGNAGRGMYVLVGASDRVYARADGPDSPDVVRVPCYEEQAVHQLLRRGWLTVGNRTKDLSCGAATLTGTTVGCPKSTTARVQRWAALSRPPSWTAPSTTAERPRLRMVRKERNR